MKTLKSLSLAQRDMILVFCALGALVILCWWSLISMAREMSDMGDGSAHMPMGVQSWTLADFFGMFAMWVIMMVGMMVPTAIRALMIFTRIGQQAAARGRAVIPTYWFALGYIIIWTLFCVAATGLQWGFDQAALLSPMMVSTSANLGAAIFILAGLWQFSPIKDVCLRHCRSPAQYIASHFKPGRKGAIRLGLHHGLYCLGCCWLLMGLLFVGGVMNIIWIAAITAFVLAEKLLPASYRTAHISGLGMILAGGVYLFWAFT